MTIPIADMAARIKNSHSCSASGRKIDLRLTGVPSGAELTFLSLDGNTRAPVRVPSGTPTVQIDVPDFASTFWVSGAGATSPRQELLCEPASTTSLRVRAAANNLGAFLRTIGVQNAAAIEWKIEPKQAKATSSGPQPE